MVNLYKSGEVAAVPGVVFPSLFIPSAGAEARLSHRAGIRFDLSGGERSEAAAE